MAARADGAAGSAPLSRRAMLGLLGATALTAACSPSRHRSSGGTATAPRPSTPPSAPPSSASASSPPDWTALRDRMQGRLLLPSDAGYDTARQLWDPRFDDLRPQAVAYCASPSDVQRSLEVARDSGITPRPRSGGHSYGGWSSGDGLVVDTTAMAAVSVDAAGTATVGAGARLIDVYAALAGAGRALPAGSCPTVGISGLTLGGGVGVLGRSYGLTCDRLTGLELVTADGTLHSPAARDDLFWASRGGGGGNFGVATSFTFATVPAPTVTTFGCAWPWPAAADVLAAWQEWAPPAPDEIWSTLLLLAHPSSAPGTPIVRISGVCVGSVAHTRSLVDGLVRAVGTPPSDRYDASPDGILAAMLLEAGCSQLSVAQCRLPSQGPDGALERKPLIAASDYLTERLSADGIGVVVDFVEQRQTDDAVGEGGAQFDAYGGAIGRVGAPDTAFVHRNALASVQRTSSFAPGDSAATIDRGHRWLREFTAALRPHVSGGSYVNYPDPDLVDWAPAYYGSNLPRLQRIRAAADPDQLFDFPQGL